MEPETNVDVSALLSASVSFVRTLPVMVVSSLPVKLLVMALGKLLPAALTDTAPIDQLTPCSNDAPLMVTDALPASIDEPPFSKVNRELLDHWEVCCEPAVFANGSFQYCASITTSPGALATVTEPVKFSRNVVPLLPTKVPYGVVWSTPLKVVAPAAASV